MRRALVPVLVVGCGEVEPRAPDAGGGAVPGAFAWQRDFAGSFPAVALVGDRPYVGASQFAPLDLGTDIALTGEFTGTAAFGGPSFTSAGFLDSFVARYTGDGAHAWSRQAGGAADDRGLGVAIDASGAVYYSGAFHGTVGFGGAPLTARDADWSGAVARYRP